MHVTAGAYRAEGGRHLPPTFTNFEQICQRKNEIFGQIDWKLPVDLLTELRSLAYQKVC